MRTIVSEKEAQEHAAANAAAALHRAEWEGQRAVRDLAEQGQLGPLLKLAEAALAAARKMVEP